MIRTLWLLLQLCLQTACWLEFTHQFSREIRNTPVDWDRCNKVEILSTGDPWQDAEAVQYALTHVPDGTTIVLGNGLFAFTEPIEFGRGVKLTGQGPHHTTITRDNLYLTHCQDPFKFVVLSR
jgi:hypothetical protein